MSELASKERKTRRQEKKTQTPTTTPVNTKRRLMCGGHQRVENGKTMFNTWQINVHSRWCRKYHYRRMSTSLIKICSVVLLLLLLIKKSFVSMSSVCLNCYPPQKLKDSIDCHTESYVFQSLLLWYQCYSVLCALCIYILWCYTRRALWLRSIL